MSHRIRRRRSQSGVTLIEVLIAGIILIFGVVSVLGLIMLAIGNNGRSKIDSSATMLGQAVVEQMTAMLAGGGPSSITDCDANTWAIAIVAGPPPDGAGAKLAGNGIDFAESTPPDGYHMDYAVCNGAVKTYYDVRWNVQNMSAGGTYLVTVGARPKKALAQRFMFSLPITMRAYVGGN